MFVESMSFKEIRQEILSDITTVQNKLLAQAKTISKVMRKTNIRRIKKFYEYRSPVNKNHWLYQLEIIDPYSTRFYVNLISQFTTTHGYCAVTYIPDSGRTYIFKSHFFTRYNQRNEIGLVMPKDIMETFLDENPYYVHRLLEQTGPDKHEVFVQFAYGVGLGEYYSSLNLFNIRTFITNDMLKSNQIEISHEIEKTYDIVVFR